MTEFRFQPTKTYATEDNARRAAENVCEPGDRFMIVGTAERFAPIFFGVTSGLHGAYAFAGFTVVN